MRSGIPCFAQPAFLNGTPNPKSPQNVVTPNQCTLNPVYLQISNQNLQPEKSDNWTVGVILEPVVGWLTTLDYYDIKLKNQIIPAASTATYNPLNFAVRGAPQLVTFGDGSSGLSSTGLIAYATSPFVNAQTTETTGIDFATGYRWRTKDYGKFRANLAVDPHLQL